MKKTVHKNRLRRRGDARRARKRKGTGLGAQRRKRRHKWAKHRRRHGSCPDSCGLPLHSGIDCYYASELLRINSSGEAWGVKSQARAALREEMAKRAADRSGSR